ncbi:MAG: glycosyltransferase family 2 protein [Hyphomonas sp.]|nr:glycosyltransferase family 2 protein [Hyphomonas sp.]
MKFSMNSAVSPSVTVILPTFNRAHLIAESVDSLLAQTWPIKEIIIVDDGSTDQTDRVVAAYEGQVHCLKKANGGKLSALNVGLSQATGDLVWIMDDDDIAPSNALENLIAPFLEDGNTNISYGALRKFTVDSRTGEKEYLKTFPYPPEDERSFFVRVLEDCFITGQPCLLVRKACYDAIYPLPEHVTVSEDYAVLIDLARLYDARRIEAVTLLQRQHEGPRGPGDIRYAADTRYARWCEADTNLMKGILPTLSLEELGGDDRNPRNVRRALFQKAVIAARKKLWPSAIEALDEAVKADPMSPLEPLEKKILGGMLGCRYGLDELMDCPDWMDRVREALAPLNDRNEALSRIAGMLPYRIRIRLMERDFRRAGAYWRLFWRLAGIRLGVRTGVSKLIGAA